jgi:uncharacterized protein
MYKRNIDLAASSRKTVFLWGARQTGKSTLLKTLFPGARRYDLLLSDTYRQLVSNPSLIRQECEAADLTGKTQKQPIVIDEIQKVPDLLDEVHWLIENRGLRFILCGSSARKLKRGHGNLLGGRAPRYELHPLVYPEISDFSLSRALTCGLLPPHYTSDAPGELLRGYVGDYLKEEIAAEALTRNVSAFNHFMEVAALSNGEIINYTNIASECGVSAPTVKGHFQILEDTLVGRALPAYSKRGKRRLISTPKFYFFDTGVAGQLTRRGAVEPGTELFGRVFEHYLLMELWAHAEYSGKHYPVCYWRTSSQIEVDVVLGDHEVAIEIKGTKMAQDCHLKGLRAFKDDYVSRHYLAVTLDVNPRKTSDGIEILPWRVFLDRLWDGRII